MSHLAPLFAAITPFIIWPVELLLPYPFVVEEAAKAVLVLFVVRIPSKLNQVKLVTASAILFTMSESVLYMLNIALVGDLSLLLTRFALTAAMHSLTMLLMLGYTFWNKWLMPVGVAVAMLIHYYYNLAVAGAFQKPVGIFLLLAILFELTLLLNRYFLRSRLLCALKDGKE